MADEEFDEGGGNAQLISCIEVSVNYLFQKI